MSRSARVSILIVGIMTGLVTGCGSESPAGMLEKKNGIQTESAELERVLKRIMVPPRIRTEQGFTARVLIAPGQSKLYDPLFMRDHSDLVWINDDGGQEGEKGGQILAIDHQGSVSDVIALGRLLPVIGFDIAPASFAPYTGQIFTVSQAEIGHSGHTAGHIVQRVDPNTHNQAELFCDLPPAGGADGKGVPWMGMEGRFGPEGSQFAARFFAVAAGNGTVYQVTSDGRCTPFVVFDQEKWGLPFGLAFSPDGQHMLVSMLTKAIIARVRGDGTIEPEPLVRVDEELSFWGMAFAPPGFGDYADQLFVGAIINKEMLQQKYKTNAMSGASEVYRVTPEGKLKLVASGFHFAVGVHFVRNRLWVSDPNGDFIAGVQRELPDGILIEITPN